MTHPGRTALAAVAAAAGFASAPADAHVYMTSPTPRYPMTEIKAGPCGRAGGKRTTRVTTFKPGETITVTFDEFVGHPGHYRISFDPDGVDDFVDPKTATEFNSAPSVLVDNIKDKSGSMSYSQEVKLPDIECGNCTLQLIQVMTDKAPFGNGDDIYYNCADLVLSKAGAPPDGGVAADGPPDAPASDGAGAGGGGGGSAQSDQAGGSGGGGGGSGYPKSSGCSVGGAGDTGPFTLVAAAVLATVRRRRRRAGQDRRPHRLRR